MSLFGCNSLTEIFCGTVFLRSTNFFIIFCDFLMLYQIFLSPQVTRCTIITYEHDIFARFYELPNDSRLRILEK